MTQYIIRPVQTTDLDAIAQLDQEHNPYPWGKHLIQESVQQQYLGLIGKTDEVKEKASLLQAKTGQLRYLWLAEKKAIADTESVTDDFSQANNTKTPNVCGFLCASCLFDESELELILVSQVHRRQGIAQQLMQTWLDYIKQKQVQQAMLEVRCSNAAAIRLYQQQGFEQVGKRKNYYVTDQSLATKREDAILMNLSMFS